MTYKKLMEKAKNGVIEVEGWSTGCCGQRYAYVMAYSANLSKQPKRKIVEITNVPSNIRI